MKGKKIVIILLIVFIVLILAVGTVAGLYFMTDMFKTNQQLFSKYASQEINLDKILEVDTADAQEEFKTTNSYTSEGELAIEVQSGENEAKSINFTTSSKHDATNGRTLTEATIKKGEEDLKKFSFVNSGDIYAIKSEDIYEHYIGAQNANLKQFARNLGVSEEAIATIPDSISLDEMQTVQLLSEQDTKYLMDTYSSVIFENITEDKYSKTKKSDIIIDGKTYQAQGYVLTLDSETVKTVLNAMLDKLGQDQTTLNIIKNMLLTVGIPQEMVNQINMQDGIQNLKTSIAQSSMELKITLYVANGKTVRIQLDSNGTSLTFDIVSATQTNQKIIITISDESSSQIMKLGIEKNTSDSGVNHIIDITNTTEDLDYQIKADTTIGNVANNSFTNISNVSIISGETNVSVDYSKTMQVATEAMDIPELNNTNTVIFNNYPIEQLQPFVAQLGQKGQEVLNSILTDLNLISSTDANQIMGYLRGIGGAVIAVSNANGAGPVVDIIESTVIYVIDTVYTTSSTAIDGASENMEATSVETFNSRFTTYEGEQTGSIVRSLCDTIIANNEVSTSLEEKIGVQRTSASEVTQVDEETTTSENIRLIKEQLSMAQTYVVDFGYNEAGRIIAIGITEGLPVSSQENTQTTN